MDVSSGQSIIKIKKNEQFWAKGGRFKVFIDDKMVGKIEDDNTEEFSVEPGRHKISVKMGWTKSKEIMIQSDVGKTSRLICGFNGFVIGILFILIVISFFPANILEPFHLGTQTEDTITIYYLVILAIVSIILSFIPSAMEYLKIIEPKEQNKG